MSASPEQVEDAKHSSAEDEAKEETEAVDSSSPSASCNPDAGDGDTGDVDLDRLRGDAIGRTSYSERFVLRTLLKLSKFDKSIEEDTKFENELCSLWDMTVEPDVVGLLLEHDVIELLSSKINVTGDKRLTEILVGMIANMCANERTRDILRANSTVVNTLLELSACSDTLTLIQLMRLFEVMIYTKNISQMREWFECFRKIPNIIDNFSYILTNSTNIDLLRQTLRAFSIILITFTRMWTLDRTSEELAKNFVELFVTDSIISGSIEAVKALLPELFNSDVVETDPQSLEQSKSTVLLFMNIHCILAQWDEPPTLRYGPQMSSFLHCMSRLIGPLGDPMQSESQREFRAEIVDGMNDIIVALGDPFNEEYVLQIAAILQAMLDGNELTPSKETNEFESDDADEIKRIASTLVGIIARTLQQAAIPQIKKIFGENSPIKIVKILNTLKSGDASNDIQKNCALILTLYDKIKDKKAAQDSKT